jgi:hypothetical protein
VRCPRTPALERLASALTAPLTLVASLVAILATGCVEPDPDPDPEPEPESQQLAAPDAWVRVSDPDADWFAELRPDDAECDDSGYYYDPLDRTIEIQTDLCDYLTLSQPTRVALEPGDAIHIGGFHDILISAEPAEGYVGVALAGEIAWTLIVPIPAPAAVFEDTFTIDRAIPEGAEIQVHVHNHGPNSWELGEIRATPGS